MNEKEFLARWDKTQASRRFRYVLNTALIAALFVLMAALLFFMLIIVSGKGFGDMLLNAFTVVYVSVFVYYCITVLRVRLKSRTDGVIIDDDGLHIRSGAVIKTLPWSDVNRDGIDFTGGMEGKGRLDGHLMVRSGCEAVKVHMFSPFLRIDSIETFVKEMLLRIKEEKKNG